MPDPEVAPGRLAIVQAFVNTAATDSQSEILATPHDLSRWLARRTLLPAGADLVEEDRRRAIEVREGIRALAMANTGASADREAVGRLDRAIREVRFQLFFDLDGSARFEPACPGVDMALAALLEIVVVTARLEETWPRLKVCANSACRRAFYDDSRNRSGIWCTKRCGDKIRGRAFRRARQ